MYGEGQNDSEKKRTKGVTFGETQQKEIPNNTYCRCNGKVKSEFFVACESGEADCPYGGWLHPECTDDLKNRSREEIDNLSEWYCEACRETR